MKRFIVLFVMLGATYSTLTLACGLDGKKAVSKEDGYEAACGSTSVSHQVFEQSDPADAMFSAATLYESCDQDKSGDGDEGDARVCFLEPDGVCDQGDPGYEDGDEAMFSFLDELYGVCYPGGDLNEQTTAGG